MIMSSLTMRHGGAGAALETVETAGGQLSAFVRRLIAAREVAAKRRVAVYLGACTDERLYDLGLSNEDIRAIRAGTFNGVRG
jgi:uncharacterized protein YjiS (DUF1127 family)